MKDINVVFATDENYVYITGVSIVSLLENNRNNSMHIFVFCEGVSAKNKKILGDLVSEYRQKITMSDLPDIEEFVGCKIDVGKWSMSTYLRLFFGNLIPDSIDRIIWLDGDIIVKKDLTMLWNYDLKNNYLAAVKDNGTVYQKMNGFSENEPYFNTGVLLVDLNKWREEKIGSSLVNQLIKQNGYSPDVDQGIINKVLKGHIEILPLRYNFQAIDGCYGIKIADIYNGWNGNLEFYSDEERIEALSDPTIIHYTGVAPFARPWKENCIHKRAQDFLYYKELSPWKNEPLQKNVLSGPIKMIKWSLEKCPFVYRWYLKIKRAILKDH